MKRQLCWVLATLIAFAPLSVRAQTGLGDGKRFQTTGAQGQPVGGIDRADSTHRVITVSASGNVMIEDANPARLDFEDGAVAIIGNPIPDTTAVGMADSSVVVNMGKYRVTALALKINPGGGAGPFAKVAVSLRFHVNQQSDSSSIVPVVLRRAGVVATVDSLSYVSRTIAPGSAIASDREVIINIQRDDMGVAKWGNSPMIYLQVCDTFGQPLYIPYVSVRIRQIAGTGIMSSVVYLIGTPL